MLTTVLTHCRVIGWNRLGDHRVCSDQDTVPDVDVSEDLGPRPDHDVVPDRGMSLNSRGYLYEDDQGCSQDRVQYSIRSVPSINDTGTVAGVSKGTNRTFLASNQKRGASLNMGILDRNVRYGDG